MTLTHSLALSLQFTSRGLEFLEQLWLSVEADHELPVHLCPVEAGHLAEALHATHARVLHFPKPLLLLLNRIRLELVRQGLVPGSVPNSNSTNTKGNTEEEDKERVSMP